MTIQERLKASGITDEEIKTLETAGLLPKLSPVIEGAYTAKDEADRLAAEAKTQKEEFENYFNNEVVPEVNKVYSDAIAANARAAALEQQNVKLKEYGFLKPETGIPPAITPTPPPGNNGPTVIPNANPVPGSPQFVTPDQLEKMVDARASGVVDAFFTAGDLQADHFELFGTPLKGLKELADEARRARITPRQMWEKKFNVQAKRDEIAKKIQEDHDNKIRQETEVRVKSEMANPMTRLGIPSIAARYNAKPDEARHPWKQDRVERHQERVQKWVQGTTH